MGTPNCAGGSASGKGNAVVLSAVRVMICAVLPIVFKNCSRVRTVEESLSGIRYQVAGVVQDQA